MEGGSNVDGDESGGTSPSRQGAGIGILVPRSLMAMAAEIGIASGKRGPESGFPRHALNICQRGASEVPRGAQAPPRRGQEGGRVGRPPGLPLAPLWPHFWRVEASGALIFYIFFPEFFWQFK